jgi:hypothetical protein
MVVSEKEFFKLEFNPSAKKPMASAYPKLRSIVGDVDDKLIRYVVLMYDINSPLRFHIPELGKRKSFAAEMAGYNVNKDDVTALFDFKISDGDEDKPYEELIDCITNYLKYQNNWMWSMVVSNEQAFYELNKRVMMPVDGQRDKDILQAIDIKTKIMTAQDDIVQRLKKYYKELTGDDTSLEEAITRRKRVTAESIAIR